MVFQNYALFPHTSVAENVGYGLRFTNPPDGQTTRERIGELLALVALEGIEDRRPEALSGGQQQRVALARALAPAPRILLLDEPMSALDAGLRERLRVELAAIQSELGVTTVYVTHDQEEALAVSDRVSVMSEGRIEQIGSPRAIYTTPRTRFVAEFIGDNNVFEGRVVESSSGGETGESGPAETSATIEVSETRFRARTAAAVGERVSLCVRPEYLNTDEETNRFRARVVSTEFLGEATRVHLDWDGRTVLARTTAAVPDGEIELGFDPSAAHVLDG